MYHPALLSPAQQPVTHGELQVAELQTAMLGDTFHIMLVEYAKSKWY